MTKVRGKEIILLLVGLSIGIGIGLTILVVVSDQSRDFLGNLIPDRENPVIGAFAPNFELASLQDNSISLSDFQGKVVVLNFWATWCTPCRLEMPMIDKYQRRFPDDLVVLAVNLQEPATDVHIFANELDLKILVLLDSKAQVSTLYKIQGLPTTYFIDPIGKIRAIHIGSLSEQQMEDYLEKVGLQQ